MSQNKTKKELRESFDGFGGLDVTSPIGSGNLLTFRNFKLLSDGSAMKRSGFSYVCTLDGEIRGEKAYSEGGDEIILAAVGNRLYRIRLADCSVTSSELFSSTEGSVKFFDFMGVLYILEGYELYRYLGECQAVRCDPYVPLYGKMWNVYRTDSNTVNESFNLLTPRIRITYNVVGSQIGDVYVGFKIKSVDGVWGNGLLFSPNVYSIHKDGDKISFNGYYFSGELYVYLTLDTEDHRDLDFEGCDRCSVFDSFDDSRVFLYGGSDKSRLYVSAPVGEDIGEEQRGLFDGSVPLYFPKDEPVRFGSADRINAVCRLYDRALICSEHRAWVTTSLRTDEGRGRTGLVLDVATDTAGCSSPLAVSIIGGDNPVTVTYGGAYKWSIDDEFEEEMRLTLISAKVEKLFDGEFVKNALVCRNRSDNELWFANSASVDGSVLVYNCDSGAWYAYDGISASALFEIADTVAFRDGNSYYLFSDEIGYDCFEWGEREIMAVVESADMDFSLASAKKHINRCHMTCELDGGRMDLELENGDTLFSRELEESDASVIHGKTDFFDIRMRTCRTQRARFRLTAHGRCRQRIYSVCFFAS